MKTCSIGYFRDDTDFAVLATINNNDDHLTEREFSYLCNQVKETFQLSLHGYYKVEMLEREDAPDYIEGIEDGTDNVQLG